MSRLLLARFRREPAVAAGAVPVAQERSANKTSRKVARRVRMVASVGSEAILRERRVPRYNVPGVFGRRPHKPPS